MEPAEEVRSDSETEEDPVGADEGNEDKDDKEEDEEEEEDPGSSDAYNSGDDEEDDDSPPASSHRLGNSQETGFPVEKEGLPDQGIRAWE